MIVQELCTLYNTLILLTLYTRMYMKKLLRCMCTYSLLIFKTKILMYQDFLLLRNSEI